MKVFPAHAGMSPFPATVKRGRPGFPRTRGDEPYALRAAPSVTTFSPHTRG